MLGISAKNHSLPALKKVGGGVDQGVQTEGRGVDLQVTLPMPAPPPRLNRGMQGGLVKPTSTEEDNGKGSCRKVIFFLWGDDLFNKKYKGQLKLGDRGR